MSSSYEAAVSTELPQSQRPAAAQSQSAPPATSTSSSLKSQLLSQVADLELVGKKIAKEVLGSTSEDGGIDGSDRQAAVDLQQLAGLFAAKELELGSLLKSVPAHQARQRYIAEMEKAAETRDQIIERVMRELKGLEDQLTEATYQAEKKLKSIRQSETNRVYSEDVIRFAHQISKSYSVASSIYWQQGDPQRPFPIEADFAISQLMLSQQVPQQPPMPLQGVGGPAMMRGMARGPMGMMRASPAANSTMMSSFMSSPGGSSVMGNMSMLRGSPLIPRGMGPGGPFGMTSTPVMTMTQHQQQSSMIGGADSPSLMGGVSRTFTATTPSGGPQRVSHPPAILQRRPSSHATTPRAQPTGALDAGASTSTRQQPPFQVEQMSSDSSSSSSSDDEGSPAPAGNDS